MPSLDDIMNRKSAEVKRPPPMPIGLYTFQVFGRPVTTDMEKAGKSSYVDFQIKVAAIGDTVTPESIEAFGGREALMGYEPKGRSGARFYLSEAALPQLKEWLTTALGIPDNDGERTLKEMVFDAPGKMVIGEVQQEPSQDGKYMVSSIRNWAKVS